MEMVSDYLILELKKDKEQLEKEIFNRYDETKPNGEKQDYNVKNQITNIFPFNRHDEGMRVTLLLEKIDHYLNTKKYDKDRQKNFIVEIRTARQTIESL